MELLLPLLQGSYAYLLILQISVVALLFFALLWLMVQRVREAKVRLQPPVTMVQADTSEWEKKVETLEREATELKPIREEANTLREKVRYLESKLMEYEILQEEIGALSELKMENESLKRELVQSKAQPTPVKETPKSPSAILFDSTAKHMAVESGDPTQAGLDNLLKKIEEMTESSRKQAK